MALASLPISSLQITAQHAAELPKDKQRSMTLNEWARATQVRFKGARCSLLGGPVGLELHSPTLGVIVVFRE